MDYLPRIELLVEYIESHLTEPLSIDCLALVSGISRWHLQRVFKACTGLPLGYYTRSRRLSEAARELVVSRRRVLDIALDYHFNTQESFARAFRQEFNCTPREYRKLASHQLLHGRQALNGKALRHIGEGITREPEIITLKKASYIGVEVELEPLPEDNEHNFSVVARAWGKLEKSGLLLSENDPIYGLVEQQLDERGQVKWLYCACVKLKADIELPAGLKVKHLEQLSYAKFIHRGSFDRLYDTSNYIYLTWLPQSGYQHAGTPSLDVFKPDFDPCQDEVEYEMLVPVVKAA